MDAHAIERRLELGTFHYVAARGFAFGPGAEGDMRFMIGEASKKLAAGETPFRQKPGPPAVTLELSIRHTQGVLHLWVDHMISVRKEVYGDTANNIIGEETFAKAREFFCPLWPICS